MRARFLRWLVKAAAQGNLVLIPDWGRKTFMRPTFQALAAEGYKANGAVFACISALAFAFPEPPLMVWDQTEAGLVPLPDHPLSQLLQRPNPQMGMAELLQFLIVYEAIGGNCYWYKVRSGAKRVVELWPIHDGQLTPVAGGGTKLIDHYDFDNGTGKPDPIVSQDIVHFKWLPDPLNPQRGLAPLVAVSREVDTDNEATSYLYALLKNDAMPRLALVVPKEANALSDEQFNRMKEQWSDEHGGSKRGGVAILEGGLTLEQMALNLQEMEFNQLRHVPEARIASAFRVPPVLAGLAVGLEQMTRDNVKAMELHFTERTLVQLWNAVASKLTSDLLPEFDQNPKRVVAFDLNKVVTLAEKNEQRRSWALPALEAGAILVNEYRAVMGLPHDANGDVYLRGLAVTESPAQIVAPKAGKVGGKSAVGPGSSGAKAKPTAAEIRKVEKLVAAQRAIRARVQKKMEPAVDAWFKDLAERVVARATKAWTPAHLERKDLPTPDDLVTDGDTAEFDDLLKRFYMTILKESWPLFDAELGVTVQFDTNDPAVAAILRRARDSAQEISDTTRAKLFDVLQQGADQGWSIQHLVAGDPETGVPGLRDIVEETYRNRAEAIARTELGTSQNLAAAGRYEAAGVNDVLIMDDGQGDEDAPCIEANGQVWTLEEYRANPLEHPNCTRAGGAYFGSAD